jgi:hypothetical protein
MRRRAKRSGVLAIAGGKKCSLLAMLGIIQDFG